VSGYSVPSASSSRSSHGLAILAAIAVLYHFVLVQGFADPRARAIAFAALVVGNVGLILSNRSQSKSIVAILSAPNPALWWVVASAPAGLLVALYVPPVRSIFQFGALSARDLALAALAGSVGVVVSEVVKLGKSVRGGTLPSIARQRRP
jgi:P-type Ca2+ transporter type 2C